MTMADFIAAGMTPWVSVRSSALTSVVGLAASGRNGVMIDRGAGAVGLNGVAHWRRGWRPRWRE